MDTELFLLGAEISGVIGAIAPFVLPSLFTLLSKIFKKDLIASEKRLVVTVLSGIIALVLILVKFQWGGEFKEDLNNFAQFFFVNFVAIKGMVQVIYELVIKNSPILEEKFS